MQVIKLATSTELTISGWHQVNWKQVNLEVQKLRGEVFASVRYSDGTKTRNHQFNILTSTAVLLKAIRKVTGKPASKTPGVDQVVITTAEEKWELFEELRELDLMEYLPPPTRRIYVPKADNLRWRPLGIPTVKDRIIQSVVVEALEPEWEAKFSYNSYGFRPGRSREDALIRCFVHLTPSKIDTPHKLREWAVVADIGQCFDSVAHKPLLNKLSNFLLINLIEKWLTAGILEEGIFVETLVGFPQGGPLSPLLCNIALNGIEYSVRRIGKNPPELIRYADDFVVLCNTLEDAQQALVVVENFLKTLGLNYKKSEKPPIVHITEGFDFLGMRIYRSVAPGLNPKTHIFKPIWDENKKLLYTPWYSERTLSSGRKATIVIIEPTKMAVKKFNQSLKEVFELCVGYDVATLIKYLNPKIKGYAQSIKHINCTKTMRLVDHYIFTRLWIFLKRTHPKKSKTWIKNRYFISNKILEDNWVLKDPKSTLTLLKLRYTKQTNHILVKGGMCKDDPTDQAKEYWAQREQDIHDLKEKEFYSYRDNFLAKEQNYTCPICGETLHNGEQLERHHIVERRNKGTDHLSNLVLIHKLCHNNIHYGGDYNSWRQKLLEYKSQTKTNSNYQFNLQTYQENNFMETEGQETLE